MILDPKININMTLWRHMQTHHHIISLFPYMLAGLALKATFLGERVVLRWSRSVPLELLIMGNIIIDALC
jgi:hypothetical protein